MKRKPARRSRSNCSAPTAKAATNTRRLPPPSANARTRSKTRTRRKAERPGARLATVGDVSDAPHVKICGITNLPDAELAVELGAWTLGMIFYEGSPRQCSALAAQEVAARLRRS